jgi:YD repeat-containing protein
VQAIGIMQDQHIVSPALELRQYRGNSMIGGTFNEPILLDGKAYPSKSYKFENSIPIVSNDSSYISNNNVLNILPSFGAKLYFDKFDDSGNILQYHTNGNNLTSIIWGYGKSYPVVKIDGIAYDQISSSSRTAIMNHSFTMETHYELVQQDVEFLKEQLGGISSDSKYSVSMYTYSPQIGRTSETNSNGTTTYYEYDELGRLTFVRNDEGKIIKQITYNYVQ